MKRAGWVHSWSGSKKKLLLPLERFNSQFITLLFKHTLTVQPVLPPTQRYRDSFLVIKRSGREIFYSLPSGAEAQDQWSYKSASSICLRTVHNIICTVLPLN